MAGVDIFVSFLHSMAHSMAVVIMAAYFVTRAAWFGDVLDGRASGKTRAKIMVICGLLGMLGSMAGIHLHGATASTQFLGPMLAGLLAGPLAGLGAGLISGCHRLLIGPAFTIVPTLAAGVLVGVVGGTYQQVVTRRTGQMIGATGATLLAILAEICNTTLVLVFSHSLAKTWALQKSIIMPVFVANVAGTVIFFHFIQSLVNERRIRQQRDQFLAQNHKIEGELSAARDIQMGMVPDMAGGAIDWPGGRLFAILHTAREVGGDFYDFFLDREGKLVFTVGDVSDKGVPAALFMAMTRTLMRGLSEPGQLPHELLARVNQELAESNRTSMFVTLFCGKLDLATGELGFSNAGHNPPLLVRRNGTVDWLRLPPGLVLGAFASSTFLMDKIILGPGDSIVAYTDGVTEAMDPEGGMYSPERLLDTIRARPGASPRELVERLDASVNAFAAGAAQSDDITLLAVQYLGGRAPAWGAVPADGAGEAFVPSGA
jgi:sigma-B regulation protein RsbU (phosphoserine phosphatase)